MAVVVVVVVIVRVMIVCGDKSCAGQL